MEENYQSEISTKEKIINKAAEIISRKGYFAVSVREIAGKVGITAGSFYNHYTSKTELMDEIISRYQSEMDSFFLQSSLPDSIDTVAEHKELEILMKKETNDFIEFWDNSYRERLWLVIAMEQHRNVHSARKVFEETEKMLNSYKVFFQQLIDKKMIKEFDPHMLAIEYVYALKSLHAQYKLSKVHAPPKHEIRQRIHDFIHFFIENLNTTNQKGN